MLAYSASSLSPANECKDMVNCLLRIVSTYISPSFISCLFHAFNRVLLIKYKPATKPIYTDWITDTQEVLFSSTQAIKKRKVNITTHLIPLFVSSIRNATLSAFGNEIKVKALTLKLM